MNDTTGLLAFLRERLDEDYKLAFEAGNGGPDHWMFNPELPWNGDHGPREAVVRFSGSALGYVAVVDPVHGKYGRWNARHIARHDPQRVLAEVAAKRRILDDVVPDIHNTEAALDDAKGLSSDPPYVWADEMLLRCLALPYADHPDYQPRWAPDA